MLDWALYRDAFSTAAMREIWSETATLSAWIRVEQTLARVQADHGIIPQEAADRLAALLAADIDTVLLAEDMALVGRPIVGLVHQLRALVGPDLARHVHFRATTQDVMDTAMVLQMRQGLEAVDQALASVTALLLDLESRHGQQRIIGRTNGQHAVPMYLATKFAVWRAELDRRSEALGQARARGLLVQIGGPVGDLSAYDGQTGVAVRAAVADAFDLGLADPHWQNARDSLAEIITALGALCASICKISHNVNLLSSSDIGELHEGYVSGRGASSAMAHKKNQRASEFGEAVARLGRQRAEQMGELTLHQHERSGGVWIAEWMLVPEVFLLASGALAWCEALFSGLSVDEAAMDRNLEAYRTRIESAKASAAT